LIFLKDFPEVAQMTDEKSELQVDNLHLDDQLNKMRHKFALVVMIKIK